MDSKRRRVGEDATTSSPQRAGATSTSSSTASSISSSASAPAALNGQESTANGRANGLAPPATPRIRTNGIKPTTPAVPSPLRQTWQADSPPQQPSHAQPASKPTRAASFMTELIKEVTPPKKPAFANPYEAANPMIKPAPKKQPARKTRASTRAKAQEEVQKKEPELTFQAIIEATVPKVRTLLTRSPGPILRYYAGKQALSASPRTYGSEVSGEGEEGSVSPRNRCDTA